jgi:23S rRNA (pseudouridine1915-N3)-methyltransferase
MTIRLFLFGKNKPAYVEEGVQTFVKQIRPYCNLSIHYLKDNKVHSNVDKVLSEEAKTLLPQLQADEYIVVCDDKGKSFDSIGLANHFSKLLDRGQGKIAIIVGSAHGLAPEVKEKADLRLSLSALTMNHQVLRLFLLEQLYRIFTIQRGMSYHK